MEVNAGLKASIGVSSGLTSREEFLGKTEYVVDGISSLVVS